MYNFGVPAKVEISFMSFFEIDAKPKNIQGILFRKKGDTENARGVAYKDFPKRNPMYNCFGSEN